MELLIILALVCVFCLFVFKGNSEKLGEEVSENNEKHWEECNKFFKCFLSENKNIQEYTNVFIANMKRLAVGVSYRDFDNRQLTNAVKEMSPFEIKNLYYCTAVICYEYDCYMGHLNNESRASIKKAIHEFYETLKVALEMDEKLLFVKTRNYINDNGINFLPGLYSSLFKKFAFKEHYKKEDAFVSLSITHVFDDEFPKNYAELNDCTKIRKPEYGIDRIMDNDTDLLKLFYDECREYKKVILSISPNYKFTVQNEWYFVAWFGRAVMIVQDSDALVKDFIKLYSIESIVDKQEFNLTSGDVDTGKKIKEAVNAIMMIYGRLKKLDEFVCEKMEDDENVITGCVYVETCDCIRFNNLPAESAAEEKVSEYYFSLLEKMIDSFNR